LKKYFKIVNEIYEYFDYSGGEKIYPIEDYTDFEWNKTEKEIHYDIDNDGQYVSDEYIEEYVGEEFTMFLIKDSLNLDNCLIIFDNKKFLTEDDYRD